MFKEFRDIVKKEGLRGWRLEKKGEEFYISKFDDRFNDDEFRFYLKSTPNGIAIVRMEKIKSYKKIMNVSPNHTYTKQATQLCAWLYQTQKKKQLQV